MRDLIKHDALLWLVGFSAALIGAFRSSLFHSVICSLGGPLSHGSTVVVFFDRGHPRVWNFYSTIPVDVVRVKSYMNCLFSLYYYVLLCFTALVFSRFCSYYICTILILPRVIA